MFKINLEKTHVNTLNIVTRYSDKLSQEYNTFICTELVFIYTKKKNAKIYSKFN